jgi:uncharacterized protein (TIGR04222 family)
MSLDSDPPGTAGPDRGGDEPTPVEPAADAPTTDSAADAAATQPAATDRDRLDSHNMLPPRERRRSGVERLLVRLIATAGVVAIGVAIAAIMVSSKSQGWLVGLVVSIVSVVLAAVLWSSRQL